MRKQTKLVAVLSAAALLAMGASMTSFAAGWEKDDAGIWHYYDSDDEMVTDEWQKDGGKWFYLDDDGEMLTDSWVDDEYYVGEDGAMLINTWLKAFADEDQDDPDDDGEHWYYFGSKGKKTIDGTKKINGRTYYFNEDGEMQHGWQEIDDEGYYFGGEDEGWRVENQWLWLEKSGLLDDDDVDDGQEKVFDCTDDRDEMCDEEGWYWFQSSGKLYHGEAKKKVNGKYYMFNDHGQMLYEWINGTAKTVGSNAQLDGSSAGASASDMLYYNVVEEGWRGDGWYEIDGSEDMGNDSDTDWYYIDDGKITHAGASDKIADILDDDNNPIFVMRKKIKESGNKYFAFNEDGQMQDGLQYIEADDGFFYFDENGYMKTGKVSDVECEDDDYNFYFTTTNGKNGLGYTGEKDGYLYFNGKRLEADDDYRIYYVDGNFYLVNTKGKIQKATGSNGKKYDDIENGFYNRYDDVVVKTNSKGAIQSITVEDVSDDTAEDLRADLAQDLIAGIDVTDNDNWCSVPFIALYDDNVYTYSAKDTGRVDADGNKLYTISEGWQ
ncbi:glucan-binding protein [Clostridium transplantifaecale]|uniref:glucan-binding protein n=1 Tax=Clostridium transplantifaecale TaxID=2479838 RepID=UPI000F62E237|nr:glucan-binding protein [Clostridium transplantifaecale]